MHGAAMTPIPLRVYIYLGVALAAGVMLLASHTFAYRSGAANVKAEWNQATADANREANRINEKRKSIVDEAYKSANPRYVAAAAASASVSASLDSLQHALAARDLAEESIAAATARANTAEELFLSSGRLSARIAKEADGHVVDKLLLLEAWPE